MSRPGGLCGLDRRQAEWGTGTTFVGSLSALGRGRHLERPGGGARPQPTSLAALQRLLVAQQQLHVEGVAVLSEGNPSRVRQPLGTGPVVAYSSRRRGSCGGECRIEEVTQGPPGVGFPLAQPSAPAGGHSPP